MNETLPKKIEKVSFDIYAKAYEFCHEHGYDPNNLQFFQFSDGVDVFVGGE